MRHFTKIIVGALLMTGCANVWAGGGNLLFSAGQRTLDDNDWEPVDQQLQIGVITDIRLDESPLYIVASLQYSFDSDNVYESGTSGGESYVADIDLDAGYFDASVGLKYMPSIGDVFRPYVGLGVTAAGAAYITEGYVSGGGFYEDVDDDDSAGAIGGYVSVGSLFRIGHFALGIEARQIVATDFEFDGYDSNADALSVLGLIGFGWGD